MRPNKRNELITKALKVFYQNGFHATGMDTLVRETGISKTSMYKHFDSKDALIQAVLVQRDAAFRDWLYTRMSELSETPRGQLLALFQALEEWFHTPDFKGCMFIKANAEFQDPAHPVFQQARAHKEEIARHLTDLARQAGAAEPDALGTDLLLLKEGAIVLAAMGVSDQAAQRASACAQKLVQAQLGSAPG